ncbi:rna polymerase sigma factor : : Sigma70_r4_2 [Gemmata massiliana]|uniref:Rna polymerase sigma factor:: Sigma70_r4_2 n=1 Tax=Gemmata massiliana TaxID=1210884 RepID=A0A6P2D029_9BACT|nr:sigma-70 family RNA polymerase sigma factor [Gemmata massiliana]VTR93414.1 rna polymerase sigma factor : : Sigma70_r4_2 [Gemmata massiliana]
MTITPCRCSNPQRPPLCGPCRALEQLVPLIRRQLKKFARCFGWALTREDLADLTQRVLSELARSGQPPEQLGGLAVCITRRCLVDGIRRAAAQCREPRGDRIDVRAARPEVSDLALDVMAAMERMPPDMRRVFFACGIEQWTREEAVSRLGLSLATVRKLYAGAIRITAEVLGIDATEGNRSPRAGKSAASDIPS